MAKSLLIVESPAKARTIKKYLGKGYDVRASVGHVIDLPPKRLGVDLEGGDFAPEYQVIKGKEKVVRELKKAAANVDQVFLAPDPDREGEAIAWHLARAIGGPEERFHRVLFHELTKSAISRAMDNPGRLDENRYNSQQARRVLDRLVGYQISPLLWKKVKQGLSAGRVQSVALRLVVERERAIVAFVPEEYWSITAQLAADLPPVFAARLSKLSGKKFAAGNQEQADAALAAVKEGPWEVGKVVKRERKQSPPPPFITSTLQQEAFRKLGYAPKRTMALAQRLYEGLETGEGAVGLITYMRTDSRRLAPEAVDAARAFIVDRFGKDYIPAKPPKYKAPKGAQEAHEAIRPTGVERTPESLARFLKPDELKLYALIYNRFLSCQMAPAIYDQTQVEIAAGPGLFRASGQVMKFKGFTALYTEDKDESVNAEEEDDKDRALPPLREGQVLELKELVPKQHFTQPPPRFTEASLVKEMEEKGIGRPSTYAAVLSTLQDKKYVAKDKRHLVPTSLGSVVTDLLVESFPKVMEVDFTAGMEEDLDRVEDGRRDWRELLTEFYGPFSQALEEAKTSMRQVKGEGLPTGVKCPQCGKEMNLKLGKHGEFLACTGYPDCKMTGDAVRDEKGAISLAPPPPDPGETCEVCGAPMQVKKGRYGHFLACTAYPECTNKKPLDGEAPGAGPEPLGEPCPKCGADLVIKPTRAGGRFISCSAYPKCRYSRGLPVGVNCPECGGPIVEKVSKRGKLFYGCDNFPKCQFATWNKPLAEPCPSCGSPYLEEKTFRGKTSIICPKKDCKYTREPQ